MCINNNRCFRTVEKIYKLFTSSLRWSSKLELFWRRKMRYAFLDSSRPPFPPIKSTPFPRKGIFHNVSLFFTALFRNTRTVLKSTPVTTKFVFRCRQSSKRTSQETAVRVNQVQRSHLSVVIGRFRSILFVSVF